MGDATWVGLDVHARSVVAAVIDPRAGEVTVCKVGPQPEEVVRWLKGLPAPVRVAYEAGPTGYVLARACQAAGISCLVAAPGKIERAPGERIKTDRRDAARLARQLRMGDLTGVRVPEPEEEAARDLLRARDDVRTELMRARHRLSKLLLRHGRLWPGASNWTRAHEQWLVAQRFEIDVLEVVWQEGLETMMSALARREVLDRAIGELAETPRWAPVVGRLRCLRGVSTHTALGLCVEIGDWHRFSGASIAPFLGLVPSEHSSGQSRSQGSITKTGNVHARRLLVEAAWHQQRPVRVSRQLARRREGQPAAVRARAQLAARRLHRRWVDLHERRGKRSSVVAVAVAREMAGWCWSLAVMD